jgi:hypothetical protein
LAVTHPVDPFVEYCQLYEGDGQEVNPVTEALVNEADNDALELHANKIVLDFTHPFEHVTRAS